MTSTFDSGTSFDSGTTFDDAGGTPASGGTTPVAPTPPPPPTQIVYGNAASFPSYTVNPTASPESYTDITVSWTGCRGPAQSLRLVRSSVGPPDDVTAGVTVLSTGAPVPGTAYTFDDSTVRDSYSIGGVVVQTSSPTLPAVLAGTTIYYTVFVQDTTGAWQRGGDAQTVLPARWGYDRMLKTLPEWYYEQDELLTTLGFNSPVDTGPLARFLELFGYGADTTRTWLEQLNFVADPQRIPANLLGGLGALVGVGGESEISWAQRRQLISKVVRLYKNKGTVPGIAELASTLTGEAASVTIGPNLTLLPDLVAKLAQTGLHTNVVTTVNGAPYPPSDYDNNVGSPPFPQAWPTDKPAGLPSIPAQAWYYSIPAGLQSYSRMDFSTLLDGNPQHYGVPLPSALNVTGGSSTNQISTSTTFQISVDRLGWGQARWGVDTWGAPSMANPAPPPGPGGFAIQQTSLPNPAQGVAYDTVLSVRNAGGPVTWAVTAGTLPPGLTLQAATGEISGTPTGAGVYQFTVTATETVQATVQSNRVITAAVRLWSGGITPVPQIAAAVHFWDAYGNDLGVGGFTSGLQLADQTWRTITIPNVPVPVNAEWVSLDFTASNPSAALAFSTTSVIVAAMPDIEAAASIPTYTNPRDIRIGMAGTLTVPVLNRLISVLEGVSGGGLGSVDPFSRTGFLPLGSTFTITTADGTSTSGSLATAVGGPSSPSPHSQGWGQGTWGVSVWGG